MKPREKLLVVGTNHNSNSALNEIKQWLRSNAPGKIIALEQVPGWQVSFFAEVEKAAKEYGAKEVVSTDSKYGYTLRDRVLEHKGSEKRLLFPRFQSINMSDLHHVGKLFYELGTNPKWWVVPLTTSTMIRRALKKNADILIVGSGHAMDAEYFGRKVTKVIYKGYNWDWQGHERLFSTYDIIGRHPDEKIRNRFEKVKESFQKLEKYLQ